MSRGDIATTMRQLGAPDIKSLGPDFLMWDAAEDLKRNRRP